eukprot:7054214-Karenia_brevis.AAC.1
MHRLFSSLAPAPSILRWGGALTTAACITYQKSNPILCVPKVNPSLMAMKGLRSDFRFFVKEEFRKECGELPQLERDNEL